MSTLIIRRSVGFGALLLLAACAGAVSGSTEVELDEFSISAESVRWSEGPVHLVVENYGDFPHTLVVSRADGRLVATSDVLEGDEETTMELDLAAGVYELTCRIVVQSEDGGLFDHYERGMHASVEVVAG